MHSNNYMYLLRRRSLKIIRIKYITKTCLKSFFIFLDTHGHLCEYIENTGLELYSIEEILVESILQT